jgi:hypothetical protein
MIFFVHTGSPSGTYDDQCTLLHCATLTCRLISRQRLKYAHATIEKIRRSVLYVVRAMPGAE